MRTLYYKRVCVEDLHTHSEQSSDALMIEFWFSYSTVEVYGQAVSLREVYFKFNTAYSQSPSHLCLVLFLRELYASDIIESARVL